MGIDDAPWLPPHLTILTAHHCEEKPQEICAAESDNGVRVLNAPPFIDVPTTSKFTTGHSTLMGRGAVVTLVDVIWLSTIRNVPTAFAPRLTRGAWLDRRHRRRLLLFAGARRVRQARESGRR